MTGASGVIRGDIANLYQVRGGLLKMARDPADNDLMRREATALTRLQDAVDPALLAYFPPLVATGQRDDARSGIRRHVNLIGAFSGFRSLADVRAAFPAGVDPRDAAWMWRRLLVAIGAAHRAGWPPSPAAACWPARAADRRTRGGCWPSSTSCSSGCTGRADSGPLPCRPRETQ